MVDQSKERWIGAGSEGPEQCSGKGLESRVQAFLWLQAAAGHPPCKAPGKARVKLSCLGIN